MVPCLLCGVFCLNQYTQPRIRNNCAIVWRLLLGRLSVFSRRHAREVVVPIPLTRNLCIEYARIPAEATNALEKTRLAVLNGSRYKLSLQEVSCLLGRTTSNIRAGVSVASIASTQQTVKMARPRGLAQPDSAPLEWPWRFHFLVGGPLVESWLLSHLSR
jgi:hypothetical protein